MLYDSTYDSLGRGVKFRRMESVWWLPRVAGRDWGVNISEGQNFSFAK